MNNKTMLEVVKRILSDLNFEQVNSIYDTDDALAAARIVLNVHSAILTEYPWVIKDTLVKPLRIDLTTISVPSSTQRIHKVRYAKSRKCTEEREEIIDEPRTDPYGGQRSECSDECGIIKSTSCHSATYEYFTTDPFGCGKDNSDSDCTELMFLELEDFLKACVDEDAVCPKGCPEPDEIEFIMDSSGKLSLKINEAPGVPDEPVKYKIKINNNKDPEYWTVINGDIVLDSYCYKDGTRIQKGRLQLIGASVSELALRDDQVIDLPIEFYNYFMAEVLSTAFYNLNGTPNEKEESRSQRLRRRLLREHGLQGNKRYDINTRPEGAFWRK